MSSGFSKMSNRRPPLLNMSVTSSSFLVLADDDVVSEDVDLIDALTNCFMVVLNKKREASFTVKMCSVQFNSSEIPSPSESLEPLLSVNQYWSMYQQLRLTCS